MNIGSMRHRFTLEAPRETADDTGGANRTFVRVTDIWGMMHALRRPPTERTQDERLHQQRHYLISVRFLAIITAGHRLRLGARLFDIIGVTDPDGLKQQMHLYVEEAAP